jgi:7-cyano-7-deazaguanine synthase
MTKAIVLLSGGQDSTTSLYWARERYGGSELLALSIFYGQRHAVELEAATNIAKLADVRHAELRADVLGAIGDSDLVRKDTEIKADGGYRDDASLDAMSKGLPTSFVPGRNLLFLSLAAAVAVREGAREIVTGVCQTDFSGYPDCRRLFIDSLEKTLDLAMPSSAGPFSIQTPLMLLDKAATVRMARGFPGCWEALALSVTCYNGQRPGCGKCPACELRAKGFAEARFDDPALAA